MLRRMLDVVFWIVLPFFLLILLPQAQATEFVQQPPTSQESVGPNPSSIVEKLADRKAPALTGSGEQAKKNALAFIEWASASTKAQSEAVRRSVAAARDNKDILNSFCMEAFESAESDHSRSLVILSLIGEARSEIGQECLVKFVEQPFLEKGTRVDGEILEQGALATLQAKAIDGLAYLQTKQADRFVLASAAKNPSKIVRAEAIAAYLWNHEYSQAARATLEKYVRPEERIFIERVVKLDGEDKEVFNRKLESYLKRHPEVQPPAPAEKPQKARREPEQPPKF